MAKRNPVTVRGLELLILIAAAGNVGLPLTEAEAGDLSKAGDVTVGPKVDEKLGTYVIMLSEQGAAKLTAANMQTRTVGSHVIATNIAPPSGDRKRRATESKYGFDLLEVNESFHVAPTADMPDPYKSLASSLNQARRRHAVPVLDASGKQKQETVTVATYQKGLDGKRAKGLDGKLIKTGTEDVLRDVLRMTRNFVGASVNETDPVGVGARFWRVDDYAENDKDALITAAADGDDDNDATD